MDTLRIAVGDGCRIQVRCERRESPLCLFIHGTGDGSYVWDELLPRVANASLATIDLRGHGDSDWDPRARYGTATLAEDVFKVLNALGSRHVYLVGHSLGAAVALNVASVDRRVRKLVLIDYGLGMNRDGLERAGVQ